MIIHNLQKINLIILFNLIIQLLCSCSNHEILVKMNGSAQIKSHFFQLDEGVDSMQAQTFLNEIGIKKDTINFLKMFNECYSSSSIKNLTIEKKISDQYIINYNITNLDSLSKYLDPICGTSPIIHLTDSTFELIGSSGQADPEDDIGGYTNFLTFELKITFEKKIATFKSDQVFAKQINDNQIKIKSSVGEMNYNGKINHIKITF